MKPVSPSLKDTQQENETMSDIPEYIKGAQFINHEAAIDTEMWPRDFYRYDPSRKAVARMMELGGIINADDVEQSISLGERYAAARSCVAFVSDIGGVALYTVVTADVRKGSEHKLEGIRPSESEIDFGPDDLDYIIVTIWPYAYNRKRAWETGRWTGGQLDIIQDIEPEVPNE